ncbi:hypothetical protein [Specibacter sp. RAF43]|uniref:hypothetical protein n=1 Tax=Specibacter sp. RAF43 TaxID=3233057 RepID=UPI003F9BAC5C
MNGTPRGLNRVLLGLIGLVFMALGAALATLATVPAAGRWWQGWSARAVSGLGELARGTHFFPGGGSWIWLVVAAALLLIAVCMLSWIANQGKGRAGILHYYAGSADDDGAAGKVLLSCAVAEQALKSALLERTDLLGVSVTSYDFRGRTSLRVRVLPRQGVAPHVVAADIGALVEAMDTLVGVAVPVLVSIGSGARSRFTKAERVR